MNPLYHCLICSFVKHVFSSSARSSSLLSFGWRLPIAAYRQLASPIRETQSVVYNGLWTQQSTQKRSLTQFETNYCQQRPINRRIELFTGRGCAHFRSEQALTKNSGVLLPVIPYASRNGLTSAERFWKMSARSRIMAASLAGVSLQNLQDTFDADLKPLPALMWRSSSMAMAPLKFYLKPF